MLAVASNLFGKSSTLSAYTVHSAATSPASSSTNLPAAANAAASSVSAAATTKPFNVGLWRVIGATHKTTGKDVSVWVFEKRILDGIRPGGTQGKDWVLEQLKKEATSLSRLRHPDILHMVEPLEESRSELTFVTEVITSSIGNLLASASGGASVRPAPGRPPAGDIGGSSSGNVDLDEVEIQKGTLQIAKGLAFLHQQAKMVHLNISPDAILVNSKGDWKLSGLSLTTPLVQPDGSPTKFVFPEVDARLPPQVQWKLDFLAPEYALDSSLSPSADLYALGCVLYAVHMGGRPPFANRNSIQTLRDNADGPLVRREYAGGSRWERCSPELKDLLPRLLTRQASGRISLASLPSHPFFSSLAISTLNFLDPTAFASKPREEKATFLRGLVRVLPSFSERLKRGKILLSLLDEMKDPYLLPFLLPNVFEISKSLTKDEFAIVLPKLQPLFTLKDPPQNMLTLLDHLSLFEEKTLPPIFRENVMPLIYNSLESEHLPVQERVLKAVPHLCEILDYGTVQNVLLVKVAILFTRTRILSIKVQTLECFRSMVATLDTVTLTAKLVPLLAKIKTKEPAVMMATLAVHEAMGAKVGREAIATLVLPQLWSMSMGPLLNAEQFIRFMTVIKSLGARVEKEHSQHLREVRKMEEQTSGFANGLANGSGFDFNAAGSSGEVDFEALVKGQSPPPIVSSSTTITDPWSEDGWGDGDPDSTLSQSFAPVLTISAISSPSPPATSHSSSPRTSGSSRLKARPVPPSTFNSVAFSEPIPPAPRVPLQQQTPLSFGAIAPTPATTFTPLQPGPIGPSQITTSQTPSSSTTGPNYNISLTPQAPTQNKSFQPMFTAPLQPSMLTMPSTSNMSSMSIHHMQPVTQAVPVHPVSPSVQPPPGWTSGLMQPTAAPKPVWGNGITTSSNDWGDFDPLK